MGCNESKIKPIRINQQKQGDDQMLETVSSRVASRPLSPEDEGLPNRLLAAIPVSDLGESLDSRNWGGGGNNNNDVDDKETRANSTDSGYDDYDEPEYAGIVITESSAPELVARVEADFKPADLPELLVITGRACARILSGYQKSKREEARILDSLRDEGLLAKTKGKTAGGMSFEVVDADVGDHGFISAQFIPKRKLERLEERRVSIRKPSAKRLETRLADAEERRRNVEEERVKQVVKVSGVDRHQRMRTASALRRERQFSEGVARRQQHLDEMRKKLREQQRKGDMNRLRHYLATHDNGLSMEQEHSAALGKNAENFFDD